VHSIRAKALDEFSRRTGRAVPAIAKTFWGAPMHVLYPASHAAALYRYGFVEEAVTAFFLQRLRPGDTAIDVGAHFGYFSLLASALVGPAGRVVAFEPSPRTFAILSSNAKRPSNIRCVRAAVFSRAGRASFRDFGDTFSTLNSLFSPRFEANVPHPPSAETYDVETVALGTFCRTNGLAPDFVKIDAESAELPILRGMEAILRRKKPDLCVEVGDLGVPGVAESRKTIHHLLARGYRALECKDGKFVAHTLQRRYEPGNLFFVAR